MAMLTFGNEMTVIIQVQKFEHKRKSISFHDG